MKLRKTILALALALPLGALAENQDDLIAKYTTLSGSKQNASSLVSGLRDGKEVTLKKGETTETFTPPTGKMGYGNIDNALALASASLEKKGITNPTPAQLETAVMEILRMRADGKGWGQIADAKGFKLGEVKRADGAERVARAERPNRPERPEKPERPERPERPEKPHKPR
jgi:hypothetical protein